MSQPSLEPIVRTLLTVLGSMGREEVSADFEREFAGRGWGKLTPQDHQRVLDVMRLAPEAQDTTPGILSNPGSVRPAPPAPDPLAPIAGFKPFLDAIPKGPRVLAALDALAKTVRWSDFEQRVHQLFVAVLGFTADPVDLSPRVGQQSTIKHLKTVARHGHFQVAVVCLTETLSDTKWSATSSHYRTCLPLVPYGLLVSFEPGSGAIRFVYRQEKGDLRYRALVGPASLRDPDDNLLVWTHRVAQIPPRSESDDHLMLRERLAQQLEGPTIAMAAEWPSAPMPGTGTPPGRSLAAQLGQFRASFLQELSSPGERLVWGLNAALRACFPAPLVRGQVRLHCESYDVLGTDREIEDCWRMGTSHQFVLRLHLRLFDWSGTPLPAAPFELLATLPGPDEHGRFLLHGASALFCPPAPTLEAAAGRGGTEEWRRQPSGVLLESWLALAVEREVARHLRFLRRRLRGLIGEKRSDEGVSGPLVVAALVPALDAEGRLPLVATAALRRILTWSTLDERPQHGLAMPSRVPRRVPSWACPVLSTPSAAGRLVPVSGARIHPCGVLAAPQRDSRGQLRLAMAAEGPEAPLDHPPGPGPAAWWVGERLAPWAHLRAIGLEQPQRLVVAELLENVRVVRSPHVPERIAWVRPGVLKRPPQRLRIAQDLIAEPAQADIAVPRLLLQPGERILGARTWLEIPDRLLLHGQRSWTPKIDEIFQAITRAGTPTVALEAGEDGKAQTLRRSLWLPAGGLRVVLCAGVSPRRSRRGVFLGWRAWIELAELVELDAALVDTQGRWYSPEPAPVDLPWSLEDEEEPDIVLGGETPPSHVGSWVSGEDGELIEGAQLDDAPVYVVPPPQARLVQIMDRVQRSALRGEARASQDGGVAISRADWREWSALHPESAHEVAGAENIWPDAARARCAALLIAAEVGLPVGLFPEVWARPSAQARRVELRLRGSVAVPNLARPLQDILHRTWQEVGAPELLSWACACGALTGAPWAGRHCAHCGQPVQVRPVALDGAPWPAIPLPWPVLHPWRVEAAAALIGLTVAELRDVLGSWGPVHLREALAERLRSGDPLADGLRRLRLRGNAQGVLSPHDRAKFGLTLDRLSSTLHLDPELRCLWIEALPWPTPDLLVYGLVAGAPEPRTSPLLKRMQEVSAALALAKGLGAVRHEGFERQAHVAVQRAVDAWLGSPEDRPGLGSVAANLRLHWPLARAGLDPLTCPGLISLCGELVEDPAETSGPLVPVPLTAGALGAPPPSVNEVEAEEGISRIAALRLASFSEQQVIFTRVVWSASRAQRRRWLQAIGRICSEGKGAQVRDLTQSTGLARLLTLLDPDDRVWLERRLARWARAEVEAPLPTDDWRLPAAYRWARPRPDHSPILGFASAERGLEVLRPARMDRVGATAGDWRVRRAVALIRGRWWPWLVAVLCATNRVLRAGEREAGPTKAEQAVAGLAQAIQVSHPGLVAVIDLLEPTEQEGGRRAFEIAEEAATRSLDGLADLARASQLVAEFCVQFSQAVSGWYRVEPSTEAPMGLRWSPGGPARVSRCLLSVAHPAWRSLPEVALVSDPITFCVLDDGASGPIPTPLLRMVGLATAGEAIEGVEELRTLQSRVEHSAPSPEPVPVVTAEVDSALAPTDEPPTEIVPQHADTDIRVLDESTLTWIQRDLWRSPR